MKLGSVWGGKCISSARMWSESGRHHQIYISLSVPPWKRDERRRHGEREGEGEREQRSVGGKVIKLINLMAFVAHQTWRFSPCWVNRKEECRWWKVVNLRTKRKKQDEARCSCWLDGYQFYRCWTDKMSKIWCLWWDVHLLVGESCHSAAILAVTMGSMGRGQG